MGRGQKPTASGGIRIPDENGRETPLRKYDQKTIVLTLPGDLTVFDIGNVNILFIQILPSIRIQNLEIENQATIHWIWYFSFAFFSSFFY